MNRCWVAAVLVIAVALGAGGVTIRLVDVAASSGLTQSNTSGGKESKTFILETTGSGAAIFDYDGDGANDIFIANGTTLDGPSKDGPRTSHLYHNDGRGKFRDVSRDAGFNVEGWGQGVCVGD